MKKLIKDLRNPHFSNKTARVVFAPLALLDWKKRNRIKPFAIKHWDRAPGLMHRLYWVANQ